MLRVRGVRGFAPRQVTALFAPRVGLSAPFVVARAESVAPVSSAVRARGAAPATARGFATKFNPSTYKAAITLTDDGLHVDRALPPSFDKVLIANRGEIAVRVIRTCRQLGIKTVAIYSDADAKAMHVQLADEAYRVGPAPAAESYLRGDLVLDICKASGAQAVHPGYGFLSENAEFAAMCKARGVEFLGPPVEAIVAMGSKSASKDIMIKSNVPVVPGYHGENQDPTYLREQADKVGYPLILKAVLGGGGKGMRIVRSSEEFLDNLEACKREAIKSFKDDRVLFERYIERPRHIEFQVFADKHGNAVHLCERDCSVQRRHQKVLEEAPAPGMSKELRDKMGASAVDCAKAVGYVGAGTVEFIFDSDTDEYFFMEMNTRLQVEHPVTEMLMRRDLVQWQLHVAAGHLLPATQAQLDTQAKGHALEARVYAENPYNNFLPGTGKLHFLQQPPLSPAVRVETGVRQGDEVSIFYDPMIAKLVVWAEDRAGALRKMAQELQHYRVVGLETNIPFLLNSVNHPAFAKGRVTTNFIAENLAQLLPSTKGASHGSKDAGVALAVLSLLLREAKNACASAAASIEPASPWHATNNFRVNVPSARTVVLQPAAPTDEGAPAVTVQIMHEASGYTLAFADGGSVQASGAIVAENGEEVVVRAIVGDQSYRASVFFGANDMVHVFARNQHHQFAIPVASFGASASAGGGAVAPMAGKVVKVHVKAGQSVRAKEPLAIMEAMKMEHVIRADADGTVEKVLFGEGDFVEGGKVLVTFAKAAKDAKKK